MHDTGAADPTAPTIRATMDHRAASLRTRAGSAVSRAAAVRQRRAPLALEQIVGAGLCIGCGLCQSLAGADRVTMIETTEGRERPVARAPLDRATLQLINDVCPGVRVDAADPGRVPAGSASDRVWGPAARLVIGHASDPQLRHLAASGGVLTALADYLLRVGEIEFVVHVAPRADRPMRSSRHLSVDRAQLLRGVGSRYGPAAALIDFSQLLDRERPFALIGKPCDVSAVRALGRRDPRVDAHMRYALTMVCGGASELLKSQDVLAGFGVGERDVTVFRYRGHGNPGKTHVETAGGAVHELTYAEMWSDDESTWRIQPRCKICPDPLGDSADIVAADCWDDGDPVGEDDGFNAILVRTAAGVRLFDDAVRDGALTVMQQIGFGDLDRFQPHQLAKKYAVWPRLLGMRAAGSPALRAPGLRLRSLALTRGARGFLGQAWGAYRRTRSGRLGERAPVPERGSIERSRVD